MADEVADKQESKLLIDSDDERKDSSVAESKFLYLTCFIVSSGFFLFGYDFGSISSSMIFIAEYFSLTFFWYELIVSVAIGASVIGTLLSGYCNDLLGRKRTSMLCCVIFLIGTLNEASAYSKSQLLLGRILVGLGYGFAYISLNAYLSELAPARIRGRFVSVGSVFVCLSLFVTTLVSGLFSSIKTTGWRYMLGQGAVLELLLFLGVLLVPESPRWLISKGRDQEAVKVLQKLRGTEDVIEEMYEIKHRHQLARREGSSWSILFRMLQDSHSRRALLIACCLMAFEQLSGQTAILYYMATIIKMSGVENKAVALWLSVAVSLTPFAFAFVPVFTVDRFGRRKVLLTSIMGVFLSLALLSVTFYFEANISPLVTVAANSSHSCFTADTCNDCLYNEMCGFCYLDQGTTIENASCVPLESYSSTTSRYCQQDFELLRSYGCPSSPIINILTVIGLLMFLACYFAGFGPVPRVVISEIFPLWARSAGMACALATAFSTKLLISMSFLHVSRLITKSGWFGLVAAFTLSGWIFTYFFVPETKGKRLEHMSEVFIKSNDEHD